ncbi:alpha/beta fold hydrolase [Paracraurococcus ruber]|uniref:Alpha/beta hydrolase n=1 Tax=Paracraurococcus ruber TaxID=77675 RepID=A0ABS1D3D6_9PROT|nr:alpha/beta hydrolase [Paracraurococcus ruber]MBK1660955.1 alpha/beta hydrolase [Paracraurococcus ruber]TDG26730.1 alpha/beta hydrolase [Paracraurococcus ruber]
MRRNRLRFMLPHGFFTLAWTEWGPEDGAPVLCVHGLTRNGRDFDALAAALAGTGRRVLCPDLPGRGGSDFLPDPALYVPPTYVAALSHLLARLDGPVDWVGTSLGGICGMAVAATPGNPIRRLVLNDIGAHVPKDSVARIGDYLGQATEFADLPALEAHLRRVHAPFGALTDAEWHHLAETSARAAPGGGVALHYDPAIALPFRGAPAQDMDLSPLWERVTAPVLLLRGADSDLLLPETARAMAARPGVRLVEIPGCGHAPALMEAGQIGLVAAFLRGTGLGAGG